MPEVDPGRTGKILDENLRQLAATGEAKSISVIVEPNLPRSRVEMGGEGPSDPSPLRRRPRRVVPAEDGKSEQVVEEIGRFLKKVTGKSPVWNDVSRTFTVDITTDQLDTVARSPHIRRISKNRTLW